VYLVRRQKRQQLFTNVSTIRAPHCTLSIKFNKGIFEKNTVKAPNDVELFRKMRRIHSDISACSAHTVCFMHWNRYPVKLTSAPIYAIPSDTLKHVTSSLTITKINFIFNLK